MEPEDPQIAPEEMENLVSYFKLLRKADRDLLSKSIAKANLDLILIEDDQISSFVGKNIILPITAKEEVQGKHWNYYYKLSRVVLKSYNKKNRSLTVVNPSGSEITLEARDLFTENVKE